MLVKHSGTVETGYESAMRRLMMVLMLGTILALGIAVGLGARAVLDWRGSEPETTGATGSASGNPAASSNGGPPGAQSQARAAPTVTAAPRDVVVEVTESQLETQLNGMLVGQSLGSTPLGEARVQTVTVQLRDSLIRVGGGAKAGFLQAPFLAAGTVLPNGEGRPIVKVNEASVGGVDLPETVRTALAEALQSRVDDLLSDRSVKIRAIDIADGKMRVVGSPGS
jgi:hypothetical protein